MRRVWTNLSARFMRRFPEVRLRLIGVVLLSVLFTMVYVGQPTEVMPFAAQLLPLYLGAVYLPPQQLPWFVVFVLANVLVMVYSEDEFNAVTVARLVVVFLVAALTLRAGARRTPLGVTGATGEAMLLDLRDRIQRQGEVPPLPPGWGVDVALRSAEGTRFAGDFVVGELAEDGTSLDLVVVDVSGKGVQAGTRSLLLAGAFGALVRALPPQEFLPKANDFLLAQDWEEGFATAIHLHVRLRTGEIELRAAGHPPAVRLRSGSGTWEQIYAEGPVLGLIEDADFNCWRGRLEVGDVIMLFTDGLVETNRRDITSGIDRLVGVADRELRAHHEAAGPILERIATRSDDRALTVLRRHAAH